MIRSRLTWPKMCLLAAFAATASSVCALDLDRAARSILSDRCFTCHGPDPKTRKSDLRLDREDAMRADLGGYAAVVPGDPAASELIVRIRTDDPDEVMPPPKAKLSLTEKEKEILEAWIQEGAPWSRHWSFEPIEKPDLPEVSDAGKQWVLRDFDRFVWARLENEPLRASPMATKEQWIRRVTLDLNGLPPTHVEVEAFLEDESESAWETVVDRLLASVHFGERMAIPWLDAARYADTGGYQGDRAKTQWPWRDWVIRAYNENIPFDQFTIEQLAGDLLPNATEEQRLATAFNRNHRINDEGGIIPEEFLVEYVADRVETTSTVWMGLTMGCARCHDHKYDPLSQRDFFQLYAFFHNIPERGKDGDLAPVPNMSVYTGGTKEEHEELKKRVTELITKRDGYIDAHETEFQSWVDEQALVAKSEKGFVALPDPVIHLPLDLLEKNRTASVGRTGAPATVKGTARRVTGNEQGQFGEGVKLLQGGYLHLGKAGGEFTSNEPRSWSAWVNPTREVAGAEGPIFSRVSSDRSAGGYQVSLIEAKDGSFHLGFRLHKDRSAGRSIEVRSQATIPLKVFSHVAVSWDGSGKASGVGLFLNGKPAEVHVVADRVEQVVKQNGDLLVGAESGASSDKSVRDELLANTVLDELRLYHEALSPEQVAWLHRSDPISLATVSNARNGRRDAYLSNHYFAGNDPAYQSLVKETQAAENELKGFEAKKITKVSIMEEMETPRDTWVLERGAYDQPDKSEKLLPNVPSSLLPMPGDLPKNRLGLAKWLLLPEHPLTARVIVNRYWQMLFGAGLVRTPEDFGSQGELPTHPDLLDWLASQYRENGWDTKELLKDIVLSATYRQSSVVSSEGRELDPANRLLARGPRFRLSGYLLRDQALALSGQLDRTIGGPPVMPYQPEGLWEEVAAKGVKYEVGQGSELYRRSLYTFWRRTVPPPTMTNFDSISREICSVSLTRTNTPLQAMNLLNDPQFVEAARLMAERMMREGGTTQGERIAWGFRLALARQPEPEVLEILARGYRERLERFRRDSDSASALISVGKSQWADDLDAAELAAYTTVANVLLNLDETVTKE